MDSALGCKREVGFLKVAPRVWSYVVSAFMVEVEPQPAGQFRAAPSGLPSEMKFEGHTCFY